MVPSILRSRSSLIGEISKLKTEIIDLKNRLALISKWISSQYDETDLPFEIAISIQQCAKFIESPPPGENFEDKKEVIQPIFTEEKITGDVDENEADYGDPCQEENQEEEDITIEEDEITRISRGRKTITSTPPNGEFHCSVCNKKLINIRGLRAHEKEHLPLPPEVLVPLLGKGFTKRPRHAYKCLACGIILTNRRKYLRHINKHRRAKAIDDFRKSSEYKYISPPKSVTVCKGNNTQDPYVKLRNLTALKEDLISDLEKEYGITNFRSVINCLSSEKSRTIDKRTNQKDIHGEEEELPMELITSDDEGLLSFDPLANDNNTSNRLALKIWDDDFDLGDAKVISESEENLVDLFKVEIKEELEGDESLHDSDQCDKPPSYRHNSTSSTTLKTMAVAKSDEDDGTRVQCNICNKKLQDAKVLKAHLKEHVPPEVLLPLKPGWKYKSGGKSQRYRYRCLNCPLIFTARRQYLKHAREHNKTDGKNDEGTASVRKRNDKNTNEQSDKDSSSKNTTDEMGQCDICHKVLKVKSLPKHKEEHLPTEVMIPCEPNGKGTGKERQRYKYRCIIGTCKQIFTDKRKYIVHVKTHSSNYVPRSTEKEEVQFIPCDICNKMVNRASLVRHKREHLPPEVILPFNPDKIDIFIVGERRNRHRYKCVECDRIFASKKIYLSHATKHRKGKYIASENLEEPSDGQERPMYYCRFCNQGFKQKGFWKRHERSHTPNNTDISSEGQEQERSNKKFTCDLCGKMFPSRAALQTHKHRHLGIKPYMCFQCGKKFVRKTQLEDHELTHSDERSFKCYFCDKTFKQRQSKYVHERRHNAFKIIPCHLCGFTFSGKSNLKMHIKNIHENVRAFPCHLCDKRFKNGSALKYHINTHNNPNGRKRGLNRDVDPLKAAAKRRHVPADAYRVPIIPFVLPPNAVVSYEVTTNANK